MAEYITKQINTPTGVQTIKAYIPSDGEYFFDTSEADGVIKQRVGNTVQQLSLWDYVAQKDGLQYGTPQFAARYPNWGSVLAKASDYLKQDGVDISKIPQINLAVTQDVWKPTTSGIAAVNPAQMQQSIMKQTGGDLTKFESGEAVPYTEAQRLAIASGANGPVDAQGNPIRPEDYAKYGITGGEGTVNMAGLEQTTGDRSLNLTQQQQDELNIAYKRVLDGTATDTDRRNLEYAKTLGWNPQVGYPNFYRVGGDIYEAGTDRHIGPAEWEAQWTGRAIEVPGPGGTGGTGTGGTGAGGTGTGGISGNGWTSDQEYAYNAIQDYVLSLQAQGRIVNPDIEISDEMVNKFLDQAKTELDPYYRQVIQQAQDDMNLTMQRLSEDYTTRARALELNYGKNLEATQENFARRGLNFSTERTRAEQDLADAATTSLNNLSTDITRQAENAGIEAERNLGSINMLSSPSYTTGYSPILNRAGVYGFTSPTQSRSLYTQEGGVFGDVQRNRLYDEQNRLANLIGAEREYRGTYYK